MKHDELRSIGHNIADSLASGISLLIGSYYGTDVFGEAQTSPEGFVTVDFLNGAIKDGVASESLAKAVALYGAALPRLCAKHGIAISDFKELTARYSHDGVGWRVLVTVEDRNGRCTIDEYIGAPLRRIKTMDGLGRIRTKRN